MKYQVCIKSKNRQTAIIEGAEKLGVDPSEVQVSEEEGDSFTISLINAPGQIEIEAQDDKMSAILRTITPSSGNGTPVTVEHVEKTLSDMGIIHGIQKDIIHSIVKEVKETGETKKNIVIARGTSPEPGEKAKIKLKIGRDAANNDPKASSMVKPGQVVAVKMPATPGKQGKNIFGQDVQAVPGADIDFAAGENVVLKDNGINYTSEVYGAARGTWQKISVTDYVRVSKDRMWVDMSLFPVLADNSPLSFDDIITILKSKGIKHGINVTSIKAALEKGEPVEDFRVAEATPARNGIDAEIEFKFKINGDDPEEADKNRLDGAVDPVSITRDLVLEGEVLAIKKPAVKQEDGRTVTGELLKGNKPSDRRIKAGNNVVMRDNELEFVVAGGITAGYADYAKDTISVDSPLSVAEDKLSARVSIHPPSSKGRILTLDLVKQIITGAGISYGVDLDEIKNFLSSVENNIFPVKGIIVAKGETPVNGKNATIDLKFEQKRRAGSIIDKTDRMDFREQLSISNVKKGDILAEKIPMTMGREGKNIFGEKVPASPGRDRKLIPAVNVVLSDDGLTMTADMDGMVTVSDGAKISVLKSHEVPGDIDMSTGNLTMDGSLVIRGWVQAGFVVRATGEIHIGKGIDQATVEAGTGLYIHGGILGSGNTNIISGGDLTAFFLENARIRSKGDIVVRDDIRNSSVSTSGSIDATGGKGRIIGGTIIACRGIKVNETGSIAGVKTNIIIGVDPELSDRIDTVSRRLEEFKRQRTKIDMSLVRYSNKRKTSEIPKNIRFNLDKLIKQRRNIVQMEARLNKYKANLLKKDSAANIHPPSVTVNKIVYAGTKITINKSILDIEEDISGKVRFYLNDKNQVAYSN